MLRSHFNRIAGSDRDESGQAIVEFVLALPLVVLLIFGVLEFGRAFQIKIVLENAAREGAHYFVYNQDDADAGFADTMIAVKTESENSGVTIQDSEITVQCLEGGAVNNNCLVESTIEVIISHQYEVSVFSYFLGPITMQSNARMLVP